MFDLDKWQEILSTLRQNKLRTFLTGFSVAWGIFMLMILLGSGTGLANGVHYQFRDDAINSIWISAGRTTIPFQGLKPGRNVQLTNADHAEIARAIPGVEHITSRFYTRGHLLVARGSQHGNFSIRSVHPGHQYLEKTIVVEGRFLNDLDIAEHRKVAAIGARVRDALFGDEPSIGEYFSIGGILFKVVGVFEDVGGEGEMEQIYLPITTSQRVFNGADRVSQIMFTTGDASLEETQAMAEAAQLQLARRHRFDPEDDRALFVRNNNAGFLRILQVITGIRLFVWIIGIGTILAGVVGVSNIMMIAVQERTREIGVRKALGATPGSIIGLVLQESVLITAVSGYIGLVLGVAVLELGGAKLPNTDFFRDPSVDLGLALAATAVLVTAGCLAGFFPARKAARIQPIEALRTE
ncbi:MAG: ABC transporter permease [Acidobacteriota bacterium]